MEGKKTKLLLGILGLLIVVGVAEYTLGGGWKLVQRELRRKKMQSDNSHLGKGDKKFFEIPAPIGPEDAPIKIVVFINPYNPCHHDFVQGWQHAVEPYKDKIRLVFKDITDQESQKMLEGYPVGCETVALLNGLMEIRVPWQDEPIMFEGAMGPAGGAEVFDKFIKWALTDEGREELKRQREKFEQERQRRIKKAKELEAEKKKLEEQKASPEATTPRQSPAGSQEKPARGAEQPGSAATSSEKPSGQTKAGQPVQKQGHAAETGEIDWSKVKPDPNREKPVVPFSPDSWAQGGEGGACPAESPGH